MQFEFDERLLKISADGKTSERTYQLNPTTDPKSIDLTEDGKVGRGIYELQGDTLRIALREGDRERPTTFDSRPKSTDVVLLLKRANVADDVEAKQTKPEHSGPLTEELARDLLPAAASFSNADFAKLAKSPRPDVIDSKPLSWVVLMLQTNKDKPEEQRDFRFLINGVPQMTRIAEAMSLSKSQGFVSIIQEEYITECQISKGADANRATGVVTFNAPNLYVGSAVFEAKKHNDQWTISKFSLVNRKIAIVRGEDGKWRQVDSSSASD